uniref:Kinesin-like protein n=1 Tax=Rhabditophanes sp. KR3021 TaxID=114890 RepID=A0AC35THQ1_9BILA
MYRNEVYGAGGKSSIKVGVRVRPISTKETRENQRLIVKVNEITKNIVIAGGDVETTPKYVKVDHAFGERSTQRQIYKDMVSDYIPHLLSGYNCTIFAYGQTGTGKTYTMEGECGSRNEQDNFTWNSEGDAGVMLRAAHHILDHLNNSNCESSVISVNYVELYNEDVYDLLSETPFAKLAIYEDSKSGSVFIKDVRNFPIKTLGHFTEALSLGSTNRTTSATKMNNRSSRSHALFTVNVEWTENCSGVLETRKGKLNLVDLAGSESIGKSGATGANAREASNINTSLLTLGQVINALTAKSKHIPYRSSKLTRLLKDSLGGSALTCLIAAISPVEGNRCETLSTLEYGKKAMNVMNDVKANVRVTGAITSDGGSRYAFINAFSKNYALVGYEACKRSVLENLDAVDYFARLDSFFLVEDDFLAECEELKRQYDVELVQLEEEQVNVGIKLRNADQELAKSSRLLKLTERNFNELVKENEELQKKCQDISDAPKQYSVLMKERLGKQQKLCQELQSLISQEKYEEWVSVMGNNYEILANFGNDVKVTRADLMKKLNAAHKNLSEKKNDLLQETSQKLEVGEATVLGLRAEYLTKASRLCELNEIQRTAISKYGAANSALTATLKTRLADKEALHEEAKNDLEKLKKRREENHVRDLKDLKEIKDGLEEIKNIKLTLDYSPKFYEMQALLETINRECG